MNILYRVVIAVALLASVQVFSDDELSVTQHETHIDGELISYEATSGFLELKGDKQPLQAKIFFTTYARKNVEGTRPITFCFNGGPGSSSIWLHIGFAGPKTVHSEDGKNFSTAVEENPHSLLDITDLVFVDPVSTGYSTPLNPEEEKAFHGVNADIQYLADFIEAYLSKFDRWDSPRFFLGESYGTFRVSALAGYLHDQMFIGTDGVILISPAVDFQTIITAPGNDLPYPLFLPSYTAAACAHGKISCDSLEELLEEAKAFASTEYLLALFRGDSLTHEEKLDIANKVAYFTGLSPEYVYKSNLRVAPLRFVKELLREEGLTIGRFDGSIAGYSEDLITEALQGCLLQDPSFAIIANAFTSSFNQYLKRDLDVHMEERYNLLNIATHPWNWNASLGYINASDHLFNIITKGAGTHLFVGNGYFDIATPFFASEYTVAHLKLPSDCLERVTVENYLGGHMMYLDKNTLAALKRDLTAFYAKALAK